MKSEKPTTEGTPRTSGNRKSKAGAGRSPKAGGKHPLLMKRGGTKPESVAQTGLAAAGEPGPQEAENVAAELPQLVQLPVETAKVKLSVKELSPVAMLDLLTRVGAGMTISPQYSTLPVVSDVTGARVGLESVLENIALLETQLREARITLGQWMEACGAVLNRAALACENKDSSPTVLVNAGWTLRRGRGPAHDMPPPSGLNLKQTGFAGLGVARWRSVPNAQYYEVQMDPVPGAPLTIAESVLLTSGRVKLPLPTVAPGSLVTLCVRAVGAKGAGPFCNALTVRVN